MDLLSLKPSDYRALAEWLEARAGEIELVIPNVVKSANSIAFEGKFAKRAKADLTVLRSQGDKGADAVRAAAKVARGRAGALEEAQAAERHRREVAAAEARQRAEAEQT